MSNLRVFGVSESLSERSVPAAHAGNLKQIIEQPKWMLAAPATRQESQCASHRCVNVNKFGGNFIFILQFVGILCVG